MEKENTTLTEIITIYERMQKGRAADAVFRVSKYGLPTAIMENDSNQIVEETIPLVPSFNVIPDSNNSTSDQQQQQNDHGGDGGGPPIFSSSIGLSTTGSNISLLSVSSTTSSSKVSNTQPYYQSTADRFPPSVINGNGTTPIFQSKILDFNKYKYLNPKKYIFFSSSTNLIQSDFLEGLAPNYYDLLKTKFYWLNITDPNEADLSILFSSFNVHDLTISDIREGNTEEKIEIFKHYTFISMRLMCDDNIKERGQDMDFNILLFKDFVITIHDKKWASIKDILGFVNLLCCHTHSVLTPDWVLFSVFIELAQDAQFLVDGMEPEINKIRIGSKSLNEMSEIMRQIFDMEFQIYTISRYLKPKMNILRTLKIKCGKRLNKIVVRLLSDIRDDFKEISHDLDTLDHILERSQDTFLALVNIEKSREANEMSVVMQRISEIALVFLPIQAVGGFLGMNVQVPYQDEDSTMYFWVIIGGSLLLGLIMYMMRTCLLNRGICRGDKKYR